MCSLKSVWTLFVGGFSRDSTFRSLYYYIFSRHGQSLYSPSLSIQALRIMDTFWTLLFFNAIQYSFWNFFISRIRYSCIWWKWTSNGWTGCWMVTYPLLSACNLIDCFTKLFFELLFSVLWQNIMNLLCLTMFSDEGVKYYLEPSRTSSILDASSHNVQVILNRAKLPHKIQVSSNTHIIFS